MPDAIVHIRLGETRPLFAYASAESGETVSITGTPKIAIYDIHGDIVLAPSSSNVYYDTGEGTTRRIWYILDTSSLGLQASYYTAVFTFSAVGSDSIVRAYVVPIAIDIRSFA